MDVELRPAKPRPASLSLVTVTSLEKKSSLFIDVSSRPRPRSFGFVYDNNNINNFYDKYLEMPQIVVDSALDDDNNKQFPLKDVVQTINTLSINSPPIKYLTPPARTRHRSTTESVSTVSTHSSNSSLKGKNKKLNRSVSDCDDNVSIGGCSIGGLGSVFAADDDYHSDISAVNRPIDSAHMTARLVSFLSVMYALVIIVTAALICVYDLDTADSDINHIFMSGMTLIGFAWLIFLHWDIHRYKRWAVEYLRPESGSTVDDNCSKRSNFDDTMSITTAVIFNSINQSQPQWPSPSKADSIGSAGDKTAFETAYRFIHGKHSGNFYLKCGMTVFCFGSIIYMGVQLFTEVYYYINGVEKCEDPLEILYLILRITFSFYQLFIAFKYSNIIINRYRTIASFALMHLVGVSMATWFATILNEAIDDYVKVMHSENHTISGNAFTALVKHHTYCLEKSIINAGSLESLPYLYPFTVEFNIIMASVWYTIWTNIGKEHSNSGVHYMRAEVSENSMGEQEIEYYSSMAINADCHASNRGLFGGLSTLLATFVTIVIFFTTQSYDNFSVTIYSAQTGVLTVLCCAVVPLAYRQMRTLDVVRPEHRDNPTTAMDDMLVLIPIPFFLIHYIHLIMAAIDKPTANGVVLIMIYVLTIFQVFIQSPFIVDGIRRCANTKRQRFLKPGRELITFALILNITLWILNTFELKSVDRYHGMEEYYGQMTWMIISHTTLPLMLFYRFHSSVCLSDIWKYAYEKDDSFHHS